MLNYAPQMFLDKKIKPWLKATYNNGNSIRKIMHKDTGKK